MSSHECLARLNGRAGASAWTDLLHPPKAFQWVRAVEQERYWDSARFG